MKADWSEDALATIRNFLDILEARKLARGASVLTGGKSLSGLEGKFGEKVKVLGDGLVIPREQAISAAISLTNDGFGPVSVQSPEFLFFEVNSVFADFTDALRRNA